MVCFACPIPKSAVALTARRLCCHDGTIPLSSPWAPCTQRLPARGTTLSCSSSSAFRMLRRCPPPHRLHFSSLLPPPGPTAGLPAASRWQSTIASPAAASKDPHPERRKKKKEQQQGRRPGIGLAKARTRAVKRAKARRTKRRRRSPTSRGALKTKKKPKKMMMMMMKRPRPRRMPRAGKYLVLRRRLEHLRRLRRAATVELAERRRMEALLRSEGKRGGGRGDNEHPQSDGGEASAAAARQRLLRLLPTNEALESAAAWTLREARDPRTELEFTRHLLHGLLLSLASPVSTKWDPFDVKPQVFAMDQFMALPVFTSHYHLHRFCARFSITVRDPSGVLWVDGNAASGQEDRSRPAAALAAPGTTTTTTNTNEAAAAEQISVKEEEEEVEARDPGENSSPASTEMDVSAATELLFDLLEEEPSCSPQKERTTSASASVAVAVKNKTKQKKMAGWRKKRNRRNATLSSRTRARARKGKEGRGKGKGEDQAVAASRKQQRQRQQQQQHQQQQQREKEEEEKKRRRREEMEAQLSSIRPFSIQQARPLPTFGLPFVLPYCIGYFADVNTLLHNASILPPSVDIVLNPSSPLELVLSREKTDAILHAADGGSGGAASLLRTAYERVERALRREFAAFFETHCPEVRCASSACIAVPVTGEDQELLRATEEEIAAGRGGGRRERGLAGLSPLERQRALLWRRREAQHAGGVQFEVAMLLDSEDEAATFSRLQRGKASGALLGHYCLDVLPLRHAAPHVQEAAHVFYTAAAKQTHPEKTEQRGDGAKQAGDKEEGLGVFQQVGRSVCINPIQDADSYYHDPSNAYVEPHALFTESLKYKT